MSGITAGQQADLRDLVHTLAGLLDCAHDRPLVESKYCPGCHRRWPAAEFSRDRYRADGLAHRCRSCVKRGRHSVAARSSSVQEGKTG